MGAAARRRVSERCSLNTHSSSPHVSPRSHQPPRCREHGPVVQHMASTSTPVPWPSDRLASSGATRKEFWIAARYRRGVIRFHARDAMLPPSRPRMQGEWFVFGTPGRFIVLYHGTLFSFTPGSWLRWPAASPAAPRPRPETATGRSGLECPSPRRSQASSRVP